MLILHWIQLHGFLRMKIVQHFKYKLDKNKYFLQCSQIHVSKVKIGNTVDEWVACLTSVPVKAQTSDIQ